MNIKNDWEYVGIVCKQHYVNNITVVVLRAKLKIKLLNKIMLFVLKCRRHSSDHDV